MAFPAVPAVRYAPARMTDRLQIWAVSDGRAGIENQALGLAEAVARRAPAEVTLKRVRWRPAFDRLPSFLKVAPRRMLDPASDPLGPPWPDLWIAAGRASLPLSINVRRWSGGRSLVVQLQDPRWPAHLFDLVVAPRHDRVHGDNVLPITGSPHRVSAERLAEAAPAFADRIDPLPAPRVAVLVGGRSRAFDLSPVRAARLATAIEQAVSARGGSILLTFSRRTPPAARALMTARLKDLPGIIWDGEGPNPYFAFLGAADYVLVTEDSTNMAVEAATTGKPVFILPMDGESLKFRRFHEELERLDVARPFGGALYDWAYPPLDETGRAADEVLRRLAAR